MFQENAPDVADLADRSSRGPAINVVIREPWEPEYHVTSGSCPTTALELELDTFDPMTLVIGPEMKAMLA